VLYPGQYSLQSVVAGLRVTKAQLLIEINPAGYLQGIASFSGYDAQGHETTWVASFYNFRATGPDKLTVEVFGALGTPRLGTLSLERTARGDLVGHIALPKVPYPIQFHRNAAL
jgi:hypothetical protein